MSDNIKIQIVLTDARQKYISNYLKTSNYIIYENYEYVKGDFDYTVLPMMYQHTFDILEDSSNKVFLGGNFTQEELLAGKKNNNLLIDYFNNEEVKYQNAFLTAEAAVSLAITQTKFTLKDSECLIVGFGRIGKLISKLMSVFTNNITISARKDLDLALINTLGFNRIETNMIYDINKFDVIFNTIPHLVLNRDILSTFNPNSLIIDLASKPGGIDFDFALKNKINCIHALALPHKISPLSDAKILSNSIIKIISERS